MEKAIYKIVYLIKLRKLRVGRHLAFTLKDNSKRNVEQESATSVWINKTVFLDQETSPDEECSNVYMELFMKELVLQLRGVYFKYGSYTVLLDQPLDPVVG